MIVYTVVGIIFLSSVLFSFYSHLKEMTSPTLAVAGFILAMFQWHQVRYEDSYEKNLSRLDKVNEFLINFPEVTQIIPHIFSVPSNSTIFNDKNLCIKVLYVYMELDLLEHALDKYSQGLSTSKMTVERIHTFVSRCESDQFSTIAKHQIKIASYNKMTINVVNQIIDNSYLRQKIKRICSV